jgi:putative DNA primase/helicase
MILNDELLELLNLQEQKKQQQQHQNGYEDAPDKSHELLAQIFVNEHKHEARYVPIWDAWMLWDGKRWKKDEQLTTFTWARIVCRKVATSLNAPSLASVAPYEAVLKIARSDPSIVATHDQWNKDLWLLNAPDGTIDLKTGKLKQHNPNDYITKITKVAPKKSECPKWQDHLHLVLGGSAALIDYHQRLFGYCLTGETSEQMFAFAWGEGNNGKSMTFNTIMNLMGDYAQSAQIETFTATKNEQHPTGLARLQGARLVVVSENEQGKRLRESTIRLLTGGEPIVARFMRQDEFQYIPELKLIMFGNHKPSLSDVGINMRRRLHFLPYTVTIPPEKMIKGFDKILEQEMECILQWMIEGAVQWYQDGLTAPDIVTKATDDYFTEQDWFQRFMDECLDQSDKTAFTETKAILKQQHDWAEANNERKLKDKDLKAALEQRGIKFKRNKHQRGYLGIKVSQDHLNNNNNASVAANLNTWSGRNWGHPPG